MKKKNKKRLIAGLLCAALLIAGCARQAEPAPVTDEKTAGQKNGGESASASLELPPAHSVPEHVTQFRYETKIQKELPGGKTTEPAEDPDEESGITVRKYGDSLYDRIAEIRTDDPAGFRTDPETQLGYRDLTRRYGARLCLFVGYAEGERETHDPTAGEVKLFPDKAYRTDTAVRVEKVLRGTVEGETVTVIEDFSAREEEGVYVIRKAGSAPPYSILRDGKKMLFFAVPDSGSIYRQVAPALPVPADYAEPTAESRQALYQYYRGDPAQVAAQKESPHAAEEIAEAELPGRFPDAVILQIAEKYRLRLWPVLHKAYAPLEEGALLSLDYYVPYQ